MLWIDDNGVFFKNPLYYGGRVIFNPPAELLIATGYHQYTPPEPPAPPPVPPAPPITAYHFSKYKIKQLLGEEGWELKKSELVASGLWDDFELCTYLATDDPLFSQVWEDLSDEEKQLLIDNCQFED